MSTSSKNTFSTAAVTTPTDREIHLKRVFDAPRERVWHAMTDPKLLAQWWGRGNKLVIERLEVERGGHWRFCRACSGRHLRIRGSVPRGVAAGVPRHDLRMGRNARPRRRQHHNASRSRRRRTKLVSTSLFHTTEGMLKSGMEAGMNQSYAALDKVLASL